MRLFFESALAINFFLPLYLTLTSTGFLVPLAPMVIPGNQYSNFYH